MDKTIAVMLGATVIFITAIAALGFLNSGIADFRDGSDRVEKQGCYYQQSKFLTEKDVEESDLSSRCKNDEFEGTKQRLGVVEALNSGL